MKSTETGFVLQTIGETQPSGKGSTRRMIEGKLKWKNKKKKAKRKRKNVTKRGGEL